LSNKECGDESEDISMGQNRISEYDAARLLDIITLSIASCFIRAISPTRADKPHSTAPAIIAGPALLSLPITAMRSIRPLTSAFKASISAC